MTFAIFYELGDLSSLAGSLQAANLPNTIKNRGRPFWNNGLKDWATAPTGAAPGDVNCPLCRTCVITSGTLAEFRQLCYDTADFLAPPGSVGTESGNYLRALADDMARSSGAKEPWP